MTNKRKSKYTTIFFFLPLPQSKFRTVKERESDKERRRGGATRIERCAFIKLTLPYTYKTESEKQKQKQTRNFFFFPEMTSFIVKKKFNSKTFIDRTHLDN